mmetsp:Transcript_6626/g.18565  ORF Transcript_6626/g.18565 Transcript_6626/m.18565 type:complete len:250 (+) Transcript_6626:179-928(+)
MAGCLDAMARSSTLGRMEAAGPARARGPKMTKLPPDNRLPSRVTTAKCSTSECSECGGAAAWEWLLHHRVSKAPAKCLGSATSWVMRTTRRPAIAMSWPRLTWTRGLPGFRFWPSRAMGIALWRATTWTWHSIASMWSWIKPKRCWKATAKTADRPSQVTKTTRLKAAQGALIFLELLLRARRLASSGQQRLPKQPTGLSRHCAGMANLARVAAKREASRTGRVHRCPLAWTARLRLWTLAWIAPATLT